MRYPDGSLIGDMNDAMRATFSASLLAPSTSSVNENLTTYDLLPVVINKVPTVVVPIVEGSTPKIKPIRLADGRGDQLFIGSDGVIRVCIGTSISLKFVAEQPDKFNVENGIPVIIPNQQDLRYVWKVDEVELASFNNTRLQSSLKVDHDQCIITNIQLQHRGVYQCEVFNDIGSVLSEPVTIEVFNPDTNPKIYANLISNPYGQEGLDSWNSTTSEFVTKELSTIPTDQLKIVNNTAVFGYNVDMMHPRPYQLNPGVLKGVDLASNLTRRGNYFSRSAYKFMVKGGSTYVRAYQDIDLSDLSDVISGGVYGIKGLRAVFGCYIGTGVSNYRPTEELTPLRDRTNRRQHYFGAPRLSLENWLAAGFPEIIDRAFVTIEEFQDETRLSSLLRDSDNQVRLESRTITLHDPYTKALSQAPQVAYYPGSTRFPSDVYELGLVSPNNITDRILYAADSLMPDYGTRFTYGQFVEFNRLILDKLDPRTNKIRVSINFFCEDFRIIDPGRISDMGSDEVWDFQGWSHPARRNTFVDASTFGTSSIYERLRGSDTEPATEKFLVQPDPRPMVTGLTLGLIPILNHKPELTDNYTTNALSINNHPSAEVPSTLQPIPFDPLQRRLRNLHTTFIHQSTFSSQSRDVTAIRLDVEPNQGSPYQLQATQYQLFPFTSDLPADFHVGGALHDTPELMQWRVVSSRRGDLTSSGDWGSLIERTGSLAGGQLWSSYAEINQYTRDVVASRLDSGLFAKATDGPNGGLVFDENGSLSAPNQWNNKVRYILHYVLRDRAVDNSTSNLVLVNNNSPNPSQVFTDEIIASNQLLSYNSYLVEIDHPDRGFVPRVTFSRTSDMVGSGSLNPVIAESGINSQGYLYFKVPDQIIYNGVDQGGLGLAFSGQSVTRAVQVSRSGSLPVRYLVDNAADWWQVGQLYGDALRKQVIQSVFVGPEDGLVVTTDGIDSYVQESVPRKLFRDASKDMLYDVLSLIATGSLTSTQIDNLSQQIEDRYTRLYGPNGNQFKLINNWPLTGQVIERFDFELVNVAGVFQFESLIEAQSKVGVSYDNKEAPYYPSSSLGLSGSVILTPSASTDVNTTTLIFATTSSSLFESVADTPQLYRNPDRAISLYAVQAASYGSVDGEVFGGTPVLGYDSAGNYYHVDIPMIQDNIVHDNASWINLEL